MSIINNIFLGQVHCLKNRFFISFISISFHFTVFLSYRNISPVENLLRLAVNPDTGSVAVECANGSILKYSFGNVDLAIFHFRGCKHSLMSLLLDGR